MKLFLLRHAEAQSDQQSDDFERILTQKGCDDAHTLGRLMKEKEYMPGHIVCSAAKRTQQTLEHLSLGLNANNLEESDISQPLYNAAAGDILAIIQAQNTKNPLLVIGHNPGIPQLVQILTGEAMSQYAPCTLSVIEYPALDQWADITPNNGALIECVHPQ